MKKLTPNQEKPKKLMDSSDVKDFNKYMKDAAQTSATYSHKAHVSASKVILTKKSTYKTPPKSVEERLKRIDEVSEKILSSKENSLEFLKTAGIIK
jgi:hypothetical protein